MRDLIIKQVEAYLLKKLNKEQWTRILDLIEEIGKENNKQDEVQLKAYLFIIDFRNKFGCLDVKDKKIIEDFKDLVETHRDMLELILNQED